MLVQSPASHSQSMSMPHLNTAEAALASPGNMAWDNQRSYSVDSMDIVTWNYYTLPPSPPTSVGSNAEDSPKPDTKIIPCFTPESQSGRDQQSCLPTNQVFDLDGVEAPSSASSVSSPPLIPRQLTLSSDNGPQLKKSFSTIGGVKKGRGSGERVTTKDFVPPDVTGLSKREARLLKNRAAAFLSRQRKREEFEAMEIRVKELEEENSRLHALAEKGNKYDDLLSNLEQLRLRLSVAEKRERELTVELANQAVVNLAVKTESHDINIPPTSCGAIGQPSTTTIMRESLLSSLPSLLSLPSQTSLPITFSVPLTGSSSTRPSTTSFNHQATPCDIKYRGRPRFGHGSVGFHSNSVDAESSRKLGIGGEFPEARQFDMDAHYFAGGFSISFDTSMSEDGRGSVRVHISEKIPKTGIHGDRQRTSSLASWHVGDGSLGTTCYTSPPLSAPTGIPSPGGIDHLGTFAGAGNALPRMGFDPQLISSGYPPFGQHDPEQTFDYYPSLALE